jgi:hypothetical protein
MLGFTDADETRAGYVYFGVLVIAVVAVIGWTDAAWRAPEAAIDAEPPLVPTGTGR